MCNKDFSSSNLARNPIYIPKDVSVKLKDRFLSVSKSDVILTRKVHFSVKINISDVITVFVDDIANKKHQGTTIAHIRNMIKGCCEGFTKILKFTGVGYKVLIKADKIDISIGYSHDVSIDVPKNLQLSSSNPVELKIFGRDIETVHQFAAFVRSKRPPNPYTGKGIMYADEPIVLKEIKSKKG